MLLVVGDLHLAAALGHRDRLAHGVGHRVGVEDDHAIDVAGGPAHGLDQRGGRAQEALLVGVEDGHEGHLGQIEALPQEVDADQDVDGAEPELAQDLDAGDGVDIGVQVLHADAGVGQVVGEVLRHLLGQRRHEDTAAGLDRAPDPGQQVVHLSFGGHDRDLGVDQPGGADDLLHHLLGVLELERPRRGRHEDALGDALDELLEAQRPVVLGRGEPETVLDEHVLAGAVTGVLSVQLRHGDVALVDHAEVVLGEEIQQRVGRLPRRPAVEVAAVVLDARAHAGLGQHLEVVLGADPEALGLEQLALLLELLEALAQLHLDGADGALDYVVAGDVVRGRIDGHVLHLLSHLAGQHVEGDDAVDRVAEELDSQRLLLVGRVDLHRVTPGPEGAPDEVDVVAGVLQVDQPAQHVALVHLLAHRDAEDAVAVLVGRAQSIDAGDRRHHDHVASHQERRRRGVPEAVDLVVDGRVLLYIGVRRRQVRLGLVVVVVRDEELDAVLREEVP